MKLTSPHFKDNEMIPSRYTCDGRNVNPTLKIEEIPNSTKSLVLIVDDPDAPMGNWDHWIVWNIPPTDSILEDNIPGTQGLNDFRQLNYSGPCPPSGTHRYMFRIYALDCQLDLHEGARKIEVMTAMEGRILKETMIIGLYQKA